MIDLLKQLREEHALILQMLDRDEDIIKIIDFVEKVHHTKEEELLFPFVSAQPWLSQGGPMCTFFRGLQLDFNPFEPVRKQLQLFYQKSGQTAPSHHEYSWLTEQNPLSIPMEEHHVGHEISSALRFLTNEKNPELSAEFFSKFKNFYVELLRVHIAKEDNCLFVMCESRIR